MKNLEVNKTVKYALLIEYDGNNLVGWQKQNEGISVQGSLEEAAKNIFNQEFEIQGSGRTDAGVHALGQVAHFDVDNMKIDDANWHCLTVSQRDRESGEFSMNKAPMHNLVD